MFSELLRSACRPYQLVLVVWILAVHVNAATNDVAVDRAAENPHSSSNSILITPAFLTGLADELRLKQPAIKAAKARTNAAGAALKAVKTWQDPRLTIGGMAGPKMMRSDDGDLIYGAEQDLPLFGRPGAERTLARAELEMESARLEYEFQRFRADLAKAAFRAALAAEKVNIGEQDLAWLKTIVTAAQARYQSGRISFIDFLRVENEESERKVELENDRDDLLQKYAVLNRLLNRDLQAAWPRLELPAPGPNVKYSSKLARVALEFEPRISVMREDIKRGQALVEVTKKQALPEVAAGVESRNYTGNGEFRQAMVSLSVSIPWFNAGKYRHEIRRDAAKVSELEQNLLAYEQELLEEISDLTVRASAAGRRALVFQKEVIPRTESALESTRISWEAGQTSFNDLLEVRRSLLRARLTAQEAVAEQYQILSELVLCCGLGDLGALEMLQEADTSSSENAPKE